MTFNDNFDVNNFFNKDYEKIKIEVIELLRVKYVLEIINENPIVFKHIKY